MSSENLVNVMKNIGNVLLDNIDRIPVYKDNDTTLVVVEDNSLGARLRVSLTTFTYQDPDGEGEPVTELIAQTCFSSPDMELETGMTVLGSPEGAVSVLSKVMEYNPEANLVIESINMFMENIDVVVDQLLHN